MVRPAKMGTAHQKLTCGYRWTKAAVRDWPMVPMVPGDLRESGAVSRINILPGHAKKKAEGELGIAQ